MTINYKIYDTATLLGVQRRFEPVSNYWLDLLYPEVVMSQDQYIDFAQLGDGRRPIAPLVVPHNQGVPIYKDAVEMERVQPAYLKPKDPVDPARALKRFAGGMFDLNVEVSPEQRYDAIVADINRVHRESIERHWEKLAGEAAVNGKVVLEAPDYPRKLVDFKRDPSHTIVLGPGANWNDPDHDIVGDIQAWRNQVRISKGGSTNRLTVGGDAWEAMRKNKSVRAELNTEIRGTAADLKTGLREGLEVEHVGRLSGTLEIVVYADWFTDPYTNEMTTVLGSKEVCLTGDVKGVRAFGAILDKKAGLKALPIFPSMWDANDPPVTWVMNQSSAIMVPVNKNATLKATVLS